MRSDRSLSRFSKNHLYYEIEMLILVGDALLHQPPHGIPLQNALIESFGIHLRQIIEFLYYDKPWGDDVTAKDYVDAANEKAWLRVRRPLPQRLKRARHRAHKELVHLTIKRNAGRGRKKAWPVPALLKAMRRPLAIFCQHALRRRLHSAVRDLVAQGPWGP